MRPLLARPSLIGAILALLVGAGAYVYLTSSSDGVAAPIERVSVVVATHDIPIRSRVTVKDLELRDVPVEAAHPLALRTTDAAEGQFALGNIRAGEQVLSADVGDHPGGSPLARLLPDGMRALSVGVSDAMAAGGLVEPGDRVDVIAVFDESKADTTAAVPVAADVEVLAVSSALLGADDPQAEDQRSSSPTSISATVTLALPSAIAQRVALADEFGAIRIVLRGEGDAGQSVSTPTSLDEIIGVLTGVGTFSTAPPADLGPGS